MLKQGKKIIVLITANAQFARRAAKQWAQKHGCDVHIFDSCITALNYPSILNHADLILVRGDFKGAGDCILSLENQVGLYDRVYGLCIKKPMKGYPHIREDQIGKTLK